jgi:NAD(P)H-hydrate epimerase
MGTTVRADYTVTFGLPKLGNMLFPGYELGGELYVSHISFPPSMTSADSLKVEIGGPLQLPPRRKDAHKGDLGQVLFIAGAAGYYGAPYFAALSFLKAGGGYSRLAAPRSITPFLANKGSEIVFLPQDETSAGSIALDNKRSLLELSQRMDMVVLGPGLSLEAESQQLARELAAEIEKPLLIDGDGITALCQDLNLIKSRKAETILTPHLGEMARITGTDVGEIDANKVDVLQRTARELDATIVLKGAHSLSGYPDERVFINMSGNPGMATAGSGDVLTGTIAAMFGLGLPLQDAVRQGVFVHGLAGDLAADDKGEDGITAQDILDYLPPATKAVRKGLNERLRDRYAGARVI